ncbi:phosphatase PAP2 family protein [Fodinicola acaciae]|uniref:phosphatase PAP2 family protein n=1 Tax=Fodinicola acaciae TaxID=2681555 RepID=UPI0013D33F48|nr:phosphatase PAP2 family protein [Fodinicola acaciae]
MPPQHWKLLAGLACVAVAGVAGWLLQDVVPPVDLWIATRLYDPSPAIYPAIGGLGTLVALGLVLLLLAVVWRRHGLRPGALLRYAALLACCLATALLQVVFQRPGPPQHEPDWTYPSGHVVVITALAVTAVAIASSVSVRWAGIATAVGVIAILLVSVSRVVVAQHWLVDVVAAALATVGVGVVAATVMRLPAKA